MVRRVWIAMVVFSALVCVAQEARGGSAAIDALLQTTLDAKNSHPGDPVTANVLADMKTADGRVIIPKGALFSGKVISATPKSASNNKESAVEITFDTLKFSDGKEYPVAATVQAIQAKLSREDDTPTVGLGAPTRAMGGTNNGGVTSDISAGSGDRERGSVMAETTENYQIGKPMPQKATGVHGIRNVALNVHEATSVISSPKVDVKVPSGSQLLLVVRNR